MKILRIMFVFVLTLALGATAWATDYTWDGTGDGTTFDDAGNWSPAGSAFTTNDHYTVDDGSAVSVTGTLDIQSFFLAGNDGSMTIEEGASVSINKSAETHIDSSSTLTIDGTLSTGAYRYDLRGNGGTLNIIVNGTLDSEPANNLMSTGCNMLIDVHGSMDFGVGPMGRVAGGGQRDHTISIFTNGVVTMQRDLQLQATNGHTASVRLIGGDLDMGTLSYLYGDLNLSDEDNGIIFQSAESSVFMDGDQTNTVQGWIDDGALSSTVGDLQVRYDAGSDLTTVIPEPATIGLLGAAMGGLMLLRRRIR
ncbi:PEP-CTERM sorting domain-containing protein [Kiritimatiella glycovorans]|uniref:PEP-CTERM protein-sorting domain-containing protein n=1 Tax=Kiritimatiella glycovorans TaxID=1307763 RepID=A0A0G3EFC8_9BACT|nr:PEP-CTERM sorting domain-containing protein [Kiritimatiella glycovorans]AKJ65156.1 hypothetical protein L21SP4_01921 [Kiritimatiella glycovorans]